MRTPATDGGRPDRDASRPVADRRARPRAAARKHVLLQRLRAARGARVRSVRAALPQGRQLPRGNCVVPIELQHGGAAPPGGVIDAVPARADGVRRSAVAMTRRGTLQPRLRRAATARDRRTAMEDQRLRVIGIGRPRRPAARAAAASVAAGTALRALAPQAAAEHAQRRGTSGAVQTRGQCGETPAVQPRGESPERAPRRPADDDRDRRGLQPGVHVSHRAI